ncbi:MAG: hypothetical protein LBR85_04565 [Oscillospiraceae bacterium]|nr:hypothetical protein [Oscillospiraceae bacterium]
MNRSTNAFSTILSPRSYVTAGFDILFPALAEYIYQTLKAKRSDCWEEYFGQAVDLTYFLDNTDELRLLNIALENSTSVYPKKINDYFSNLKTIRNNWAHPRNNETDLIWARYAIKTMVYLSILIDSPKTTQELTNLLDLIQKKNFIGIREDLITFLLQEVFEPIENFAKATEEVLRIAAHSRELLKQTKTAEDVSYFFWDAIFDKSQSYDAIKECGLPTFEDIRREFEYRCYGK